MGAFLLYNKNTKAINLDSSLALFKKKGFSNPFNFDLGDYSLFLYQKKFIDAQNYYQESACEIYGVGTIIYKKRFAQSALKAILHDYIRNTFNHDEIRGNFLIIIQEQGKLIWLTDPENVYNIFYDTDRTVISSSFLAILEALPDSQRYNQNAILEALTTGSILGSDTIIEGIKRVDIKSPPHFQNLVWQRIKPDIKDIRINNYQEALDTQIDVLDEYFDSVSPVLKETGFDMGVTGGFDSRLLILQSLKYNNAPVLYSHYRKQNNPELDIAKLIANKLNRELISPFVKSTEDMSISELKEQFEKAFFYLDGQIRANAFWTEAYNQPEYRSNFTNASSLGMNGIGGEQYRNYERVIFNRSNLAEWHYNETAFKFLGPVFYKKERYNDFINYMNSKIISLGFNHKKGYSHTDLKKFLNEAFVPSCRGLRASIENQQIYFLSPFTDYKVSQNAYRIVPWLGLSNKFEIDLINKIDTTLSKVPTTYGYDLVGGEPLKRKLLTVIKEFMPSRVYYNYIHKSKKRNNYYSQIISLFPELQKMEEKLIQLVPEINLEYLKPIPSHSHLLLALLYFMDYFKNKIRL